MKATKRFLSAIMAMSMVFGTVVSVSAADEDNVTANSGAGGGWSGTMEGSGSSEGHVDMEVFRIQLPTTSISYVVDAQGLIKQSTANGSAKTRGEGKTTVVYSTKEAAKEITDAKVAPINAATQAAASQTADPTKWNYVKEDGFVFFETSTGEGAKKTTRLANYLNIEIENKSSFGVDVNPVLTYSVENGISGDVYKSAAETGKLAFNLYLKEEEKEGSKVTYKYDKTTLDATTKVSVGDASKYYETVYVNADPTNNVTEGYKYNLNETKYKAAKDLKNKLTFTLEGVAATDIEGGKNPGKVSIVWNFSKTEPAATSNP